LLGWRKAQASARITGIKMHDLRHYFASGLIAAGCDVVTVQRALGHAKATTTLNTYAHLWPTAEDRTRTAAGELMASVLSAAATPADPCGRRAGDNALTCISASLYTLKRKSTTSPSALT
jgi:hypothetical protein